MNGKESQDLEEIARWANTNIERYEMLLITACLRVARNEGWDAMRVPGLMEDAAGAFREILREANRMRAENDQSNEENP